VRETPDIAAQNSLRITSSPSAPVAEPSRHFKTRIKSTFAIAVQPLVPISGPCQMCMKMQEPAPGLPSAL
jgi:hypothetical protein